MTNKTKPVKEIVLPKIMQDCILKYGYMLQAHAKGKDSDKATLAYVKAKEKAALWFAANDRKLTKLKDDNIPSISPCGPGFRD
jgi:hypothetical protein